jgi:hypothetical protein
MGVIAPGNGPTKGSTEDYYPAYHQGPRSKPNLMFVGRLGRDEFTKEFAELESQSKNLKTAGSSVMDEFRKTRRFASKTQGGPWHF